MASYFLDTSAIVKRYFPEQGHAWITTLCDETQGNELYLSQAALVEVVATMCRREREHSITPEERNILIDMFRQDSRDSYNLWPVDTNLYISAGDLCRTYRLRAYDAIQLACALAAHQHITANRVSDPIFVCADFGLIEVATAAGLRVEKPEQLSIADGSSC